jgi:hypothetical protein
VKSLPPSTATALYRTKPPSECNLLATGKHLFDDEVILYPYLACSSSSPSHSPIRSGRTSVEKHNLETPKEPQELADGTKPGTPLQPLLQAAPHMLQTCSVLAFDPTDATKRVIKFWSMVLTQIESTTPCPPPTHALGCLVLHTECLG